MPGAIVVAWHQGRVVYELATGRSDLDHGIAMARDAIFRIYSMTKPITSVATMILVDAGICGLEDPIDTYLPELGERSVAVEDERGHRRLVPADGPITIADLLRHTSGFSYGYYHSSVVDHDYIEARLFAPRNTLQDFIERLAELPLGYQPGTHFCYGVSTDVLGRLIEVATDMPLERFMHEQIFHPLGMEDTAFRVDDSKIDRFVPLYAAKRGGLRLVDTSDSSRFRKETRLFSGGAGLVSTADDYLRFCRMLLNRGELEGAKILKPATVDAMLTNQLPPDSGAVQVAHLKLPEFGFGYGFSVLDQPPPAAIPHARIGERGWGGAASTHFWMLPQHDLAVVAMTQVMPFSRQLEDTIKPHVYAACGVR